MIAVKGKETERTAGREKRSRSSSVIENIAPDFQRSRSKKTTDTSYLRNVLIYAGPMMSRRSRICPTHLKGGCTRRLPWLPCFILTNRVAWIGASPLRCAFLVAIWRFRGRRDATQAPALAGTTPTIRRTTVGSIDGGRSVCRDDFVCSTFCKKNCRILNDQAIRRYRGTFD